MMSFKYTKSFTAVAFAAAVFATTGAAMTMPNPELQSLPGQISMQGESPVVARIGEVTDIAESDNITVRISGTNVLVTASYLFPAYSPLLGDLVYVTKQDAQWFVVGTMSGPINTVLDNPGFEQGTIGTTPDNWSTTIVASPAGIPTFTKEVAANPVSGRFQGMIRNQSAGVAGTSVIDIFSNAKTADDGQRWATSYFLVYAVINVNAGLVVQSGNTQVQTFIQWLDGGGALISESSTYVLYLGSNLVTPTYIRTVSTTNDAYVTAPAGTSFARMKIRATLTMNTNSATEIYLDNMVMRTPDA
jgi:hypothetical protein